MESGVRKTVRSELDSRTGALAELGAMDVPDGGWIRAIRYALGMTAADLARRVGVTAPAVSQIERSETQQTIQLSTLRRVAEALDCAVVYALVPRVPIAQSVSERARFVAREELGRVGRTMSLEGQDVEISEEQVDELAARLIDRRGLWRE